MLYPLLTVILSIGVRSSLLTWGAAGLLGIAVPVLYAMYMPEDRGGFNFDYSRELMRAHWAAVLAIVLLMVVCRRLLAAARRPRRGSAEPAVRVPRGEPRAHGAGRRAAPAPAHPSAPGGP
jgi:hypothetical protein